MAEVIQEVVFDQNDFQEVYDDIADNFRAAEYNDELGEFNDKLFEFHAAGFDLERDPDLSSWPPLAAATIARKKSDKILVETGRLKASLTTAGHADHVGEIFDRGLTFGTSVPYSIFHQQGTRTIPQRAHVGLAAERVDELAKTLTKSASEKLRKAE